MAEELLTLYTDVGPVTGSIRHPGPVRVFGSVQAGFSVAADGDLFVARDVRGKLEAAGDLVVNGAAAHAVLDAVGSVTVRHALDCRIVAGLDVVVRVAAERCDVAAGRRVFASEGPGLVRGGRTVARIGLEARRLDASGGVPAEVRVGVSPFPDSVAELTARAEFARQREANAEEQRPPEPRAHRRRVGELTSWRTLATTLERRLRQIGAAAAGAAPAYVRVSGPGVVRANVTIGPVTDALAAAGRPPTSGFVLVLEGDRARVRSLEEEEVRVG